MEDHPKVNTLSAPSSLHLLLLLGYKAPTNGRKLSHHCLQPRCDLLVWADFIQIARIGFWESVSLSLKGLTQLSQHLDYTGLHMHVRDVERARDNYTVLRSNFRQLYKRVARGDASHNVILVIVNDKNLQRFPM